MTVLSSKVRLATVALILFTLHPAGHAGGPSQGEKDPRFEKVDKVFAQWDKPLTLEAVLLVTPTLAQLAEYTGDYRSDEVEATYKIVLENGKLFMKHENEYKDYPKSPLGPTTVDAFVVQGLGIHFIRDARKQTTAFVLNAGRVKNIRFVKKFVVRPSGGSL